MRIDNDVTTVSNMVNEQLIDYFLNILTAVIYFISMLFIDWRFTTNGVKPLVSTMGI
jgi:ABC-type bacteriocin/lantibiotic exporter with double-glycine peptidase domain